LSQLDSAVEQLESFIDRVEASVPKDDGKDAKATTRILPGFPEKITGELLFCDADNLDLSFLI
jgi:homoaconitate hydratase